MKLFCSLIGGVLFTLHAGAMPLEGLTDLDGNAAKLDHGKTRELVVLWATWCPECKEKLKSKLVELNQRSDVAVIAVNAETDISRVKHFVEKEKVSVPVLLDLKGTLRKNLKAFSVPHWAIYQKSGTHWQLVDAAPAFEWARIEKALGFSVN